MKSDCNLLQRIHQFNLVSQVNRMGLVIYDEEFRKNFLPLPVGSSTLIVKDSKFSQKGIILLEYSIRSYRDTSLIYDIKKYTKELPVEYFLRYCNNNFKLIN